jgi:hypothetical protein
LLDAYPHLSSSLNHVLELVVSEFFLWNVSSPKVAASGGRYDTLIVTIVDKLGDSDQDVRHISIM